MRYFSHFMGFLRRRLWLMIVLAVGFLLLGIYLGFSRGQSKFELFTVQRGTITQEVSITGKVKPSASVDLAFEKSGRVARATVDVGSRVVVGQTLIELENADLLAQLAQAQAHVKAEQAKLDELKQGTRPEEIQVEMIKVQNAKTAMVDARRNLLDKINDAYTKSDDALRGKVDEIFSNPRSSAPLLNFSGGDQGLRIYAENNRPTIENTLTSWKSAIEQLTVESDLSQAVTDQNLNTIKTYLEKVALLLNGLTSNGTITQATMDSYRADASTARTNVNTAITNLSAAREKLRSAESTSSLAQNELVLSQAGTVPEKITGQEAQVEEANASVKNYQAQIGKTLIRAPISGVVTKQTAKVGEIIAPNTTVVSLISDTQFEIEADVPEADIAKIQTKDSGQVWLDAYGPEVMFTAKVVTIDPAETIVDGVSTYKVTFQFLKEDERLRSGMTANIDIVTDQQENTLFVPQRAVSGKNGERTVKILETVAGQEVVREVKVKIGLRGSNGSIEIKAGIQAGDRVVLSQS